MPSAALRLSREQILAFRRSSQALDLRLPTGPESLRRAAWAGLQDSVPRSALHSLHARVEGVHDATLDDPALVQVWGPRYTLFVVPSDAHLAFTRSRLPERGRTRERALDLAERLDAFLAGRSMRVDDAADGIGAGNPNSLRYASLTGRILIRWEGAREPHIRIAPPPGTEAMDALVDLVRRYLHWYGPSTADALARWGGVDASAAASAFERLRSELVPVRTPLGEGWMLAADESSARRQTATAAAARLLPSGDPYFLLWNADRELLVPDATHRAALWTSRVWPGALLVHGEIVGTWRRATAVVRVELWRSLSAAERQGVEEEAASLPLPGVSRKVTVGWAA
jgi:hypothetical protein